MTWSAGAYNFWMRTGCPKIAMTTPVMQSPVSKIAMTAPVVQEITDTGSIISFVMPASMTMDVLPIQNNSAVTLRSIPEQLVAIIRFSGRWNRVKHT